MRQLRALKFSLGAAVVAAAALLISTPAWADVTGSAYFVSNTEAQNAIIGFAHGSPDATFTVPSPTNPACSGSDTLCFDSRVGTNNAANYTLGAFLATGGAQNIIYAAAGDATTLLSDGSTTGTMLEFTGDVTVTTGQTFTVAHDDGLQLQIGNQLVIDQSGPTSPTTTTDTYTGPSGTFAFDLVYGECCGAPAVLAISLPLVTPVPEPSSFAILGTALLGLGLLVGFRRRIV